MSVDITKMHGLLTIDNKQESQICDVGIKVTKDGHIWFCVNGLSFIRFKPLKEKEKIKES